MVVFEKNTDSCKLATIVLRGATNNLLDDVERAIEDAVSLYRSVIKDPRFVYGGGATEMFLSQQLEAEANKIKTLDQYSFRQYAQSFEIIPRILVENAGVNANDAISKWHKLTVEKQHSIDINKNGELTSSDTLQV